MNCGNDDARRVCRSLLWVLMVYKGESWECFWQQGILEQRTGCPGGECELVRFFYGL